MGLTRDVDDVVADSMAKRRVVPSSRHPQAHSGRRRATLDLRKPSG